MYFTPAAVTLLAPAIALVSVSLYLLIYIRNKSPMEWWLCISTFLFALFAVELMLWSMLRSYHVVGQWLPLVMMFTTYLCVFPAMQFVWTFPNSYLPHSGLHKWVMRLYGVLLLVSILFAYIERIWGFSQLHSLHQFIYGIVGLYAVYAIFLLLGKWRRYRRVYLESVRRGEPRDVLEVNQKNLQAARELLVISFPLVFIASIAGVAISLFGIGLNDYLVPSLGVGLATMCVMAVVAYFNYGHQQISLSAKLTGAAFLSMLLLLTPMAFVMFSALNKNYQPNPISNQVDLLRFDPIDDSHYRVSTPEPERVAMSYSHQVTLLSFDGDQFPDYADDIDFLYRDRYEIGFDFPFYGESYDIMEIKPDGLVSLFDQQAEDIRLNRFPVPEKWLFPGRREPSNRIMAHVGYCFDRQPVISYSAESVLITWDGELASVNPEPCHYNMRLYRDGTIEFEYITIPKTYTLWDDLNHSRFIGLIPESNASSQPFNFAYGEEEISQPLKGAIAQQGIAMGAQYTHTSLIWVVIMHGVAFAIAFIVFPGFFRFNIGRPLNSLLDLVSQANRGDLTGEAPVLYQDEIGFVTGSFNQMIASVRQTRDELEDRVQERTVQLAQAAQESEAANLAKTAFLANMSHELRTPLNPILGYAQMMQGEYRDDDRPQMIYENGQHLLTLIEDILEIAKIETGVTSINPHDIDLHSTVSHVTAIIQTRLADSDVAFIVEIAPDVPRYVFADAKRLRQLLLNLLVNSVKFTKSGHISLHIDVLNLAQGIASLIFTVTDTGLGIPEEELGFIQDRFYQTKSGKEHGGVGLGLAISQSILEALDSELKIESDVDRGTRAWFELDVPYFVWMEVEHSAERRILRLKDQSQKPLVLVIDDHAGNRRLLRDAFTPLGFRFREAESGRIGFQMAQTYRPDAIICDLFMADGDGYAFAEKMQSDWAGDRPLLIAASASVFPEHREKALAHRFDHFISKPIDINALLILLGEELNVAYLDEEIGEERPETVSIMKYPSQTTLIELLESAQIGDIIKLREATSELKEQTDYVPFAEKMNRFLLSYQMQSLVDWLKELLESTRTVSSKS